MTTNKAQKKDVRARMAKTGERYTAARRHVTKDDWATHDLGVSDEKVSEATGCDWERWIYVLDRWGASGKTHAAIAKHVGETYGIGGWWAQTVTVGYERARGMRAVHERPDGYSVGVSKTISSDEATLRAWFIDGRKRSRWLGTGALTRRKGRTETSARFDAPDGSLVAVTFTAKGPQKTTVSVRCERLGSREDVERQRAVWKERLTALARLV